ncbi:galectin-5 [Myxocyprinus asiaticus]|uniref:galectin-5 n=1 Tax=Myxocyprinus asiaticus TaxID=70543 RepID=UPI002221A181|nr:galectin-5 [Myxocyprinus asiaticus]
MSCPSSGQQCNGLYPQTPQQTSGTVWPIQPCQPYWPCQPNQPTWPVSQPSTAVPTTWPVQPTQPGWPNTPSTPTSQPSPTVQPSWPAQLPTPPGYLPSPVPPTWHGNPGQPGCPGQVQTGGTQQPWPTAPVTVPFNMNFPRGIYDKLMLTIKGQVKPDAKLFTINFMRGNDIALHINPRFNEAGKAVLVRNHKLGERWGKEERDILVPFPFMPGHHFEMKILCTFTEFKVAVNNTPIFDFQHRIKEVNQINRINILHDVTLTSVTVDTLP